MQQITSEITSCWT